MLTSMQDVPPAPPGTRIAYSRGEFQVGDLRVPSGRGPHPVAIVIHGGYWRARYDFACRIVPESVLRSRRGTPKPALIAA